MNKRIKEKAKGLGYSVYGIGQGAAKVLMMLATKGQYKPDSFRISQTYNSSMKKAEEHYRKAESLITVAPRVFEHPNWISISGETGQSLIQNSFGISACFKHCKRLTNISNIDKHNIEIFSGGRSYTLRVVGEVWGGSIETFEYNNSPVYDSFGKLELSRIKNFVSFRGHRDMIYKSTVFGVSHKAENLYFFHNETNCISAVYTNIKRGELQSFLLFQNLLSVEPEIANCLKKLDFPMRNITTGS